MPENHDWQSENNDYNMNDEISSEDMRFAPPDDSIDMDASDQIIEFDDIDDADDIKDNEEPDRTFEDLTLAEMVGQFLRSPRKTGRAVSTVLRADRTQEQTRVPIPVRDLQHFMQSSPEIFDTPKSDYSPDSDKLSPVKIAFLRHS